MNSVLLDRLVKATPFAMAVFSALLMVHGVHIGANGDPGGNTGPNVIHMVHNGDPGGNTGPN